MKFFTSWKRSGLSIYRVFGIVLLLALFPPAAGAALDRVKNNTDSVPQDNINIEKLMIQGQALLDADALQQAMVIFDKILAVDPGFVAAIYQRGVIYVRMNDYNAGIALIERALEMHPDNLVYMAALASMYEFTGHADQSQLTNERIMSIADPESRHFKEAQRNSDFTQASILARSGNLTAAETAFFALTKRYTNDFMIRYSYGVALMLQNKTVQAELSLLLAKDMNPQYINIYLSLAKLYEKEQRLALAYEMLTTIVEMKEGSKIAERAQLRMSIIEAQLLLSEGNMAAASEVLEQTQGISIVDPELLFKLASMYDRLEEWPAVIHASEKLLQLIAGQPGQGQVRLRLAKAYVNTARYESAVTELEQIIDTTLDVRLGANAEDQLQRILESSAGLAIKARKRNEKIVTLQQRLAGDPDNKAILRELSNLLLAQQRWQEALPALEHLLALEPDLALNHTGVALVYNRLNKHRQAIIPYLYGISLEPDVDIAVTFISSLQLAIAKAVYSEGDFEMAGQLFSEIIVHKSNNAEAFFYAGLIYFQQDENIKAIDAFQRVLQFVPGHITARLNLAMGYHRLKREEDAIEEFRNALQFNPDEKLALRIKEQMQSLEHSIRGFSGGISYVLSYDNNSNLNASNPQAEYRTDLAPRLVYRYKAKNGLRWRFSSAPVYSSYHKGQYDFLNTNSSLTASVSQGRITLLSGMAYKVSRGLLDPRRSSDSTTYFAEWLGRFKLPSLLMPWRPDRELTNTTVRASYNEFDSLSSPFFSAYRYSLSANINQPVAARTVLSLAYRVQLSDNMEVEGSDYAFRSQGVDLSIERGIAAGLSINGSYSVTIMNYLYPDSVSAYSRFRNNQLVSASMGISYQFHESMRLFTSVNVTKNQSNLPTGFILNAEDVVEGLQSPSLGDYNRATLSAGIALSL